MKSLFTGLVWTEILVLDVPNTVGVDGEDGLSLRQAGTVVYLADSLLAPALLQVEPEHTGQFSIECGAD